MLLENLQARVIKIQKFVLKRDLLLAIVITIVLVSVGLFFGKYNNNVIPASTSTLAHYHGEPGNSLSYMSNWDGPDYIYIAQNGYSTLNNTNFFPLYPILIHFVHEIISSFLDSALLISWVALIGAVYYYLKIIKYLFNVKDNLKAIQGLLFFLLFPTAVFLLATYTESLFAFLALGAIYYALKANVFRASLFTLFATATHDNGVFVLILVALILLEEKVRLSKIFASTLVGALGLIGYMIFLSSKFNSPFGFISAQKNHGWLTAGYLSRLSSSIDLFNIVFILLIIISIIYWWNKRKSFSIYSFLFLLIPIIGGQFGGFNRYVLMVFPVQFMLFQMLRNKFLAYSIVLVLFCISWTYFLFQYAGGYIGG